MTDAIEKIPGDKSGPTDVTHQQAYEILLVLGSGTSINQLHKVLVARFVNPPSPTTVQRWSVDHDWARRLAAAAHRIEVGAEDRIISKRVQQRVSELKRLEKVIDHTLDLAGASLAGERREINGEPVPGIRLDGSVGSVATLVKTAVEASKHRQLLLGEATERHGSERELMAGVSDEHLVDRFQRALARHDDVKKAKRESVH